MTEAEKEAVRKPGRPRKYGQGRINATVRFTPERYEKLRFEADQNGRSVSEQIEHMVEQNRLLREANRALRTAYLSVTNRSQSSQVTLDELKTAGIRAKLVDDLKLGVGELAEIIEAAVTRALANARLTIGVAGNNHEDSGDQS